MNDKQKGFSITVCLDCFFSDHRAVSRIYVKKDYRIIEDLINHIKTVFNITVDIALLYDNQNLPAKEEIFILKEIDSIQVIITKKGHKQLKCLNNAAVSPPNNLEIPFKKIQKSKSKIDENGIQELHNGSNIHEKTNVQSTRKKRKNVEQKEADESIVEEEEVKCHKNEATTTVHGYELGKNNIHQEATEYTPKRKKCKLREADKVECHKNAATTASHVHESENVIGMEIANSPLSSANNDTKKCINLPKDYAQSQDSDETSMENLTSAQRPKRAGNFYRCMRKFDSLGNTLSLLRTQNDVAADKAVETENADRKEHESAEQNGFAAVAHKRHRVRHRKKKVPIAVELAAPAESTAKPIEYRPPRTYASPKVHIRFASELQEDAPPLAAVDTETEKSVAEDRSETNEETSEQHTAKCIAEENDSFFTKITEQTAKTFPMMHSGFPQQNDVICFKEFKYFGTTFGGLQRRYLNFKQSLMALDIKAGKDQCEEPVGKLTLPAEENETEEGDSNTNSFEFEWKKLIEPRLVFP